MAVTANNGNTIISHAEIKDDGEVNMVLEDVSIYAGYSAVEFVVYLNPGCEAEFEDIRITRVQ